MCFLTQQIAICLCMLCRGAVAGLTMQQGQHSMHMAAVVLLLVNAEVMHSKRKGLTKHELALASDVINEGRALMLVVNKLDACDDEEGAEVGLSAFLCIRCVLTSMQVAKDTVSLV